MQKKIAFILLLITPFWSFASENKAIEEFTLNDEQILLASEKQDLYLIF